jgi:MFS family permease
MSERSDVRFRRIATAGVFFQGGAAAVDTGTIVASLVHQLTASPLAVGAAAAIARYGWLFPQLFVAYAAQRRARRLPYYMIGAFGRVACLVAIVALLIAMPRAALTATVAGFFLLWTLYAFIGGIVAVPYNDIVARAVPSARRSRLLAWRFFGGGLLALAVAAAADRLLGAFAFPADHALVLLLGAILLLVSALFFVSAREPEAPPPGAPRSGFGAFVSEGFATFRRDSRFRLFIHARWLDGVVAMAAPFYVVQASASGIAVRDVALLLAAQTAGALASNPLWGWWGDMRGKRELLEVAALAAAAPPLLAFGWIALGSPQRETSLALFCIVFAFLGAAGNGGLRRRYGACSTSSRGRRSSSSTRPKRSPAGATASCGWRRTISTAEGCAS